MGIAYSQSAEALDGQFAAQRPVVSAKAQVDGDLDKASSDSPSSSIPSEVLDDPDVQQLAQAICSHNGRSPLCQLHDSAASEYMQYADQIADRVKFLTRKDTANIHEVSQLVPPDLIPAEEQAEKAFAQLPPFEARKTFLLGPPKPACCPERSQTTEGIHKLRQAQDAEIESILRLVCKIFESDMACCTLLTGDAYHILAGVGIMDPGICPDRWGFCAWSFLNSNHELLVIEDLKEDLRFSENYFVKDPQYDLRFYAGSPLITANGHRLGTLCLVSQKPRSFDATRSVVLGNMAELLVRQLEYKWAESEARQSNVQLMRSLACYEEAFLFLDTSKAGDWRVLHMNMAACNLLGCDWSPACLAHLAGGSTPPDSPQPPPLDGAPLTDYLDLKADCMAADVAKSHVSPSVMGAPGSPAAKQPFQLHMRLAKSVSISAEALQVAAPAYLHEKPAFGTHYFIAALIPLSETPPQQPRSSSVPSLEPVHAQLIPTSVGPRYSAPTRRFYSLPFTGPFEGLLMGVLLGKGSFGRVYRGLWKGQLVAVKVVRDVHKLKLDSCGQPLESTLTKDLKHPGIMRVLSHAWWVATDRGGSSGEQQCWMLLDYCDKGALVDAVWKGWFRSSRNPTTSQPDLRTIAMTALEIASAMTLLHSHNIVHGDLSGGNVMLTSCSINPHGFQAKLGDFGLSRTANASARVAGNVYGTITHMAPEVMIEAEIGPAADVYSFGVLLWEMLTSSRAWAGLRHAHIIYMVGIQQRTLAIPEDLHPVMESLLRQCLKSQPQERPTFKEIAGRLSDFVQVSRVVGDVDVERTDELMRSSSADESSFCMSHDGQDERDQCLMPDDVP